MTQVQRYDIFDIRLQAKAGKPFDTPLKARFAAPDGTRITVWGYYDGGDRFLIRFMPEQEGNYTYETLSPVPAMHGITGFFPVHWCGRSRQSNAGRIVPEARRWDPAFQRRNDLLCVDLSAANRPGGYDRRA